MIAAPGQRPILWVDHVSRILGGAEVNLVELLAEARTHPPWKSIVACDPAGRLHDTLQTAGIETRPYGFDQALGTLRVVGTRFPLAGALRSLRHLFRARRALRQVVAELRPRLVVSCTNKDHFAAWPACHHERLPSIWWVNDVVSPDFFPWPARRAFRHQAQRGASRLVVVSEFARRALLAEGLPPEQVVTIHNGIPLERYQPRDRGTLRRMLNLPESALLIGVLGRFTPWKGQELFVRLAEAWCRQSAVGHFALIGHAFNEDQPFELHLRDLVRQHGLRERVHFIPFQRDVSAALADLDLLVHTSLKPEPFGRVIIEAMAAGVAVLAARDGGVPEIIQHWRNGLLATPGQLADYLPLLKTILEDPPLRARLAAEGRQSVVDRFSLNRVQAEFDALFRAAAPLP